MARVDPVIAMLAETMMAETWAEFLAHVAARRWTPVAELEGWENEGGALPAAKAVSRWPDLVVFATTPSRAGSVLQRFDHRSPDAWAVVNPAVRPVPVSP